MNFPNHPKKSFESQSVHPKQVHKTVPVAHVALVEPLIPENTGNIARTCVATESHLHLIHPLGFEITESRVRRAGLDYWEHLHWSEHADMTAFFQAQAETPALAQATPRMFFIETSGRQSLYDVEFQRGDVLIFGKETTGLKADFFASHRVDPSQILHIPMSGPTRSLNLSNAVAICVFELVRQLNQNNSLYK